MSFIWPLMLIGLLLIPLLVGIYFGLLRRRQRLTANLGPLGVVKNSAGQGLGWRRHAPPLLYLISLIILIVGLARPEMFVRLPRSEGTVILAFDVSNSMIAEDLEPNRIEAAKAAARSFVENQPRTILIGVVAFSSGGLVVQQPTNNQADILAAIERLSPQGGTSLGHGIYTSINAIVGEALEIEELALEDSTAPIDIGHYPSAVVLLLTDGENTGPPDPLEIAQVAAEAGVRIYAVGIGSPEGAMLQLDGFSMITQLNEVALQEIASLTNGDYYYAKDESTLEEIYNNIDLQLTVTGQKSEVTAILAGVSLLLLLIGGALSLFWFGRLP